MIITDQDLGMKAALKDSFPDTIHRLCCWHILSKLPTKIGSLAQKKEMMKKFNDIIWRSQNCLQFETEWSNWIVENNVKDNTWLKDIYGIRSQWVPIFFSEIFCAGMKTTQRSEGMNAFLRSRVTEYNTLLEFVVRFGSALSSMREKENYRDHKDRYFISFKNIFYFLCTH